MRAPTNDIGAKYSVHMEMITQLGYPSSEIIPATQVLSKCHAGCYAMCRKTR